jgi:hypothetical protein
VVKQNNNRHKALQQTQQVHKLQIMKGEHFQGIFLEVQANVTPFNDKLNVNVALFKRFWNNFNQSFPKEVSGGEIVMYNLHLKRQSL